MKYFLYTNNPDVVNILIYFHDVCKIDIADLYRSGDIKCSSILDWETSCDVSFFGVGSTSGGFIDVTIDDKLLHMCVSNLVDDKAFLKSTDFNSREPTFVRQICIEGDIDDAFITALMKKSKSHMETKIKSSLCAKPNAINKYIYNSEDMYWDLMNSTIIRSIDSLFLRKGVKEDMFEYVKSFFSEETKTEYEKYNIPYKCNILLYGKPGTGKTSTILTIASHLRMNIGVIPIAKKLDDMSLIHAMHNVKKNKCNIIVLEDIDCLFTDRKVHDSAKNLLTLSGLLNSLDGLCRNDGVMVFMTANNISFIDDALLRSGRIDYKVYYDYADKYQIQTCFNFYFPNKKECFDEFYDRISCKDVTISMLQEFFFKHRKCDNIMTKMSELDTIINGIKEENKDSVGTMYM